MVNEGGKKAKKKVISFSGQSTQAFSPTIPLPWLSGQKNGYKKNKNKNKNKKILSSFFLIGQPYPPPS